MNPDSVDPDLSGRIKEAARLAGGGDALAQKTGLPRRTLGNYLAGRNEPKTSGLAAIAKAAGVSVAWLATGEGPMRPADQAPPPGPAEAQAAYQIAIPQELIATALQAIEEWLDEFNRRLPPAKKAEVVVLLCEMVMKEKAADRAGELSRQAGRILRLVA